MENNNEEELFDEDDILGEPTTNPKKKKLSNYVSVRDIVTDVTGYDENNEAFHNARKHEILPILKALKLVEDIDRKFYIRLGTKQYCIELLKALMFNDCYIELTKSLKKQTLSDNQKLELHNLKREIVFKVYSPLPYFHGTQEGDLIKAKDQIKFTLLDQMIKMQGFSLYKSEVLYMEVMMKNINRFLDELYIKSKEYIAHLKKQELEILAFTSYKNNPELNALTVDFMAYIERFPDNPTYKKLYELMHENLYEDLLNFYNTPETDDQLDDDYISNYIENSSEPNHLHTTELPSEETSNTIKNNQRKSLSSIDDVDIVDI